MIVYSCININLLIVFIKLWFTAYRGQIVYYIIYTVLHCDLPPHSPHCWEDPGWDSNPAGRTVWRLCRPPHLLNSFFKIVSLNFIHSFPFFTVFYIIFLSLQFKTYKFNIHYQNCNYHLIYATVKYDKQLNTLLTITQNTFN